MRTFMPPMGQHYMFFSSLLNDPYSRPEGKKFTAAEKKKAFRESGNKAIATASQAYFSTREMSMKTDEKDAQTHFQALMKQYITMLQTLANNERNAEIAYVRNMAQKFRNAENNDSISEKEREQIADFNKKLGELILNENHTITYPELITAFNLIRKDTNEAIKNIQAFYTFLGEQSVIDKLQNIHEIKQITVKDKKAPGGTKTIENSLLNFFLTNYKHFQQAYFEAGGKTFADEYPRLMAKQINDIIRQLSQDNIFLDTLENELNKANVKNPTQVVKNIIIKAVTDQYDYQSLKDNIVSLIQQRKDLPNLGYIFIDKIKDLPAIEEYALEYDKGIAEYFINIWQASMGDAKVENGLTAIQNQLLDNFGIKLETQVGKNTYNLITTLLEQLQILSSMTPDLTNDAYNKAANRAAGLKGALTRKLRALIYTKTKAAEKEKFQALLEVEVKQRDEDWRAAMDKQLKQIFAKEKITPTTLPDTLRAHLKVMNVKIPDAGEIISSISVQVLDFIGQEIKGQHHSYAGGKKFPVKTDMTFYTSFKPVDFDLTIKPRDGVEFSIKTMREQFRTMNGRLITNYDKYLKKRGEDKLLQLTDIPEYDQYLQYVKEIAQNYKYLKLNLRKDKEKKEALLTELQNIFEGGIQVKEYQTYVNGIGYKGGAIGTDNAAIDGIMKIGQLYDTFGGTNGLLTPDDINFLTDVAINYNNTKIVPPDIITAVKNYLVGGALMSMFNRGWANTEVALDAVTKMFGEQTTFQTVHLYQFDTLLIPASYLLTNICEQLQIYGQDIEQNMTITKQTAQIEFYNPLTTDDIPIPTEKDKTYYNPANRWNAIRDRAISESKMYILLMASLLDVFQTLPEYLTHSLS